MVTDPFFSKHHFCVLHILTQQLYLYLIPICGSFFSSFPLIFIQKKVSISNHIIFFFRENCTRNKTPCSSYLEEERNPQKISIRGTKPPELCSLREERNPMLELS